MKKIISFILILIISIGGIKIDNSNAAIVDNGIHYWSFNANSNDGVGTKNGTDTNITYTAGKFGNAATFNGASSQITTASETGSTNITVSFWCKSSSPLWFPISKDSDSGVRVWSFYFNSSTQLIMDFRASSGVGAGLSYNFPVAPTDWVHIVGVYSSSTPTSASLYVNGVEVASSTPTGPLQTAAQAIVFGKQQGYNRWWNGQVDEVYILSRAVTKQEVQQLYQNGPYPYSVSTNNSGLIMFE